MYVEKCSIKVRLSVLQNGLIHFDSQNIIKLPILFFMIAPNLINAICIVRLFHTHRLIHIGLLINVI